jgi:hypothetical protein
MLVLEVHTARSMPQTRIVARPQSISILKSSPNEKNGKNVFVTRMMIARPISRANNGWRIASLIVARAMMPALVK